MPLRLTVITPLPAAEADLARRRQRYTAAAGPDTVITVHNLTSGPPTLDSAGDVLLSAAAVYREASSLGRDSADALLIDSVFDQAVDELAEATGLPTFGPTRITLPLIDLVAPNFAVIARTWRQCDLLTDLIVREGYGDRLQAVRALDIGYDEAQQPAVFNRVMLERLQLVTRRDGAEAVLIGATTTAVTPAMRAMASHVPLFMPGTTALSVIELLWRGGLWPPPVTDR